MDILGIPLFAILTTWPLFLTFLICSIITLKSYLRTKNIAALYFLLGFIAFGFTYGIWGIRIIVVPIISPPEAFYWYWIAVYFFGGLSLVFFDFATMQFLKTHENHKLIVFLELLILISFTYVCYLLLSGFSTREVMLSDVSDLDIADRSVKGFLFISMGIYLGIPNLILIRFLRQSEKTTFVYKKVKILEVGMLLTSIGMALDGIRIPNNLGMTLIRWLVIIGGIIIMVSLLYRQKTE